MILINQHRQFFFYNPIIFLFAFNIYLSTYLVLILLFYLSFQSNCHFIYRDYDF